MRSPRWISTWLGKAAIVTAIVAAAVALLPSVGHSHARDSAALYPKLAATIFSYDGHDFVRTNTTLMTKDGKPAVNTKLEQDSPAFKALSEKHSFTGETTVMGRKYDANYAPLTGADGKLTGALFVGVPK
jgi:methyl-accepting chemotaxis protein